MSFKIYGALFKQTAEALQKRLGDRYDASKNYPEYSGNIDIAANEIDALLEHLTGSTPDDNGKIRIPLSAWVKEAKTGRKYLSLQISPPRETAAAPAATPAFDEDIPF